MARNYKRKGGHGGKREGAGLGAAHWDDQGGRAAAAAAMAARKAEAAEKKRKSTEEAKERWNQMLDPSSKKQKA